jgi:tRNA wybutosine-synthesizing protein 2
LSSRKRETPFQKIKESIIDQNFLSKELLVMLPRRWKRVGGVGILELKPELRPWRHQIGKIYLSFLPELSTIAFKAGIVNRTERIPDFEVLAGEQNTITLHKELNCKFWIDALKLTFSNGNHAERKRMTLLSKKNEQVLDMFACVGNLSIPLAVHNETAKIVGIEINPYAYEFLEKNIQENKLKKRYKAILGDNREKTPKNWANRVLMGYFTIDTKQFSAALDSLNQSQGGILHAHGLSSSKQPVNWVKQVESLIETSFPHFKIESSQKILIKTVAAGIEHYTNDITIASRF